MLQVFRFPCGGPLLFALGLKDFLIGKVLREFLGLAAKTTDLRFHDLRHTAATRMGDAGADAFTLAAIFGWSDIRMAMRFTHAMEDAKRRAVEAIAVGSKRNAGETPAIPVSCDHSVTNEKPAASQIAVSG